jgi:hypothetical protein
VAGLAALGRPGSEIALTSGGPVRNDQRHSSRGSEGPGPMTVRQPARQGANARSDEEMLHAPLVRRTGT